MTEYCNIIFIQNSFEDAQAEAFLAGRITSQQCADYLSQWDYGGESEHSLSITSEPPWGSSDDVERVQVEGCPYFLSYNLGLGYVGLCRYVGD